MKTPLSWIKELVPELDCTAKEYMEAMTLSGTKVESIDYLDEDLKKIVVGKIEEIRKHSAADNLSICKVRISKDEVVQIVTGAKNIFEGAFVPVVLVGGSVASDHSGNRIKGGIEIKSGELRGEVSEGMMCSISELGRDDTYYMEAEEGIYIFNKLYDNLTVGMDAISLLSLDDAVIEYEITNNRIDCYGVVGIAREAAATFNKRFEYPKIIEIKAEDKLSDRISVEVRDSKLCRRYIGAVVEDIKIQDSPLWMQRRLSSVGIRPINNIVDITNYVMVEFGQPMHAYDLEEIEDEKIIVERAANGEKFTTLDGIERELDDDILLIKDGKKAVGIAGIMGGENSKIREDVRTVFLEAACFDGTNIRLSSKKLGLRTEASGKFEKGLDPNTTEKAMKRALYLVESLGVGRVVPKLIDVYEDVVSDREIEFDLDRCNRLLGTEITREEAREYLERLELSLSEDEKTVRVPSFRKDLEKNADLAEELARLFGYDRIPTTIPNIGGNIGGESLSMEVEKIARRTFEKFGFCEAMTFSFEGKKALDKLLYPENAEERRAIKILNPLGEDYSLMRTQTINGMLTSISTNLARRNRDVRLYEIANTYIAKELPLKEYPNEIKKLTLGGYGNIDFYEMKSVVEELFLNTGQTSDLVYENRKNISFLHPGRQAYIIYMDEVVGYMGEVHPRAMEAYDIAERVYIVDLELDKICKRANFVVKYKGIAKFPSVNRDLSLVMDRDITAYTVESVIRARSGKILEEIRLFDIYEGDRIEDGKKSLAYSLIFRDKNKTLEEADITKKISEILEGLSEIGVTLRS